MKQIFTILFLAFSASAFAQGYEFRQKTDVKVVIGTDTLKNAWTGGLNSPVFSKINLNNDAAEDLYVFDRQQNKSFTFLAQNVNGTWSWVYAPEYEVLFPTDLTEWVLLRDYDGDGDKDIFSANNLGMTVYENTPVNGLPTFGPQRSLRFRISTTSSPINFNLGPYVLPSLTDMDGDGDLDVLTFDVATTYTNIFYYKNYGKELYNTADSLRFVRDNTNWGNISRCMAPNCNSFSFGAPVFCRVGATMHGEGASLLALDLDNDSDKDLLVGGDFCPDLVKLRNDVAAGNPGNGNMNAAGLSTTYPSGTTAASILNFPAPYVEDVTFDGKPDLLVAPFLLDNNDHPDYKQSSWLYNNTAASATAPPVFSFQKKNFLQDQMIDMSFGALPVFEDMDGDGDKDMLVSNYVDFRNNTYSSSVVHLYTNVGTASKPIFKLTDPDYLNFSQADNGNGYREIKLQFGDLNNDGKKDLIFKYSTFSLTGGGAAYTAYILNQATGSQLFSFSRANQVQLGVNTETPDSPCFYDLDGDGDLDLLMGTNSQYQNNANSGVLNYYRRNSNLSPDQFAAWQMVNDNVGNLPRNLDNYYPNPVIADMDADGNPELITTSPSGNIRIYRNFINNLTGTFTPTANILYNPLTNNFVSTRLGETIRSGGATLQMGIADLDGDQKPEIIVGSSGGGLVYLKNYSTPLGIKEDQLAAALKLNVYPNPANDLVTATAAEKVKVSVFDAAGREVIPASGTFKTTHQLNTANLKPGMYFLKFATEDFRSAGRTFIIQR